MQLVRFAAFAMLCCVALAGCDQHKGPGESMVGAAPVASGPGPSSPTTPTTPATPTTPTTPPTTTPTPTPTTGAMNVQIAGLAANVDAQVTVSGGSATQFLTTTQTLMNLAPGKYTVTAESVLDRKSGV